MATLVGELFRVKELCGHRNGKRRVVSKLWGVYSCQCGANFPARAKDVSTGHTKTCGCSKLKHGQKKRGNSSSTYRSWCSMLQRCNNPKATSYYMYGALGITVCSAWYTFENFYADMGPRPKGHSLDRIDTNGDYCLENCKWSTAQEQADNRSCCKQVTLDGITQPISAWAALSGTKHATIYSRLTKGWSAEEAVYGRNK